MESRPAVVVLAAGRGSRFGGPLHKLAQRLDASTVLGATLDHVLASRLPLVVVTTAALAPVAGRSVAARDVVVLPEATADGPDHGGMGVSIAAGVAARAHAPGWLVLPADMPRVQAHTLLAVAAALGEHPVAYAQYRGQRGHPVGFAAELYSELVMLSGDEGARRLVARYPAHGVEVDDPGVLLDVDTEQDLERLRGGALLATDRVQARPLS